MIATSPAYDGTTGTRIGTTFNFGRYIVTMLHGGTSTDPTNVYYDHYNEVITCVFENDSIKADPVKIRERVWNAIGSIIRLALWLHWIFKASPGFIRAPPSLISL